MKPSIRTLGEILYAPSQYVIPVFQRNYRWEEPQWDKLWESLVEIQAPEKRGNHFMGFLVFVPGLAEPGKNNTFHLIDGQQRLATVSILLAALRNEARRAGQQDLADEIHEFYLVHPKKKGEERYRLLPKERDHDSYLSIVTGNVQPAGRMAAALAFFESKLSDHVANESDRLTKVFHTICQRLEFMCATLETENAYNIFKSLNSIGVPLGSADLIRNFVFMHVPPGEHDEFDHDLWAPLEDRFARQDGTLDEVWFSRFFRDFLMSEPEGGYVSPKDTFESFEYRYAATGFSPQELAGTLTKTAQHYAIISGQEADQSLLVTQALARLNQLESSTTYPLLLALFERRASGANTSDQLAQAVDMLSGFILRRFICGESSRGYGRMFVAAIGKKDEDPFQRLEPYLLARGWPDDRRFKAAFVEFPLYQRGYTSELLQTLERSRGHKEPADLKATQIEHILPQTLSDSWREALGPDAERIHADWLHRPGNLTLSAYNLELWNHPFKMKRERYANSNIVLTRELAVNERWTDDEIRRRGELLAEEAAKIWVGPKEPPAVVQPVVAPIDSSSGEAQLSNTRQLQLDYWTGLLAALNTQSDDAKHRHPPKDSWMGFGIGHAGFYLQTFISVRKRLVGITLWISGANKANHYHKLYAQKDEIEAEVGEALTWYELPHKFSSYISLYLTESDPRDRTLWPQQHAWLIAKLEAYRSCFVGRVEELVAE